MSTPSDSSNAATAPSLWSRFAWAGRKALSVGLFLGVGVALIFAVGLAQRVGWIREPGGPSETAAASPGAIYTCPMHPQIRQPSPGRCPICGMELVPTSGGTADLDQFAVKIEPAQRRLANIQTAPVEDAPLETTIRTVGVIAIDESRQATIAAYIDGRLERLFADYTGVEIEKGDHLAILYSPQLYSAQVEYVEARRVLGGAGGLPVVRDAQQRLAANTRQRLREYGMTEDQLSELERTGTAQSRLTIYAPQGGTVVEKLAIEGAYVSAGDPIYRIAELSTVWLMLELFPEDASRIRFGQKVEASIQSLPGETRVGRVAFIDPTVDPATRTVGVRVELANDDRKLRPGDYAEASVTFPVGPQGQVFDADLAGKWISPMHPQIIRDEPGQCPICGMDLVPTSKYGFSEGEVPQPTSLSVPRSAVLLAGGNSVVYVETEPGRFEIRPVTLGAILRDRIVVLEGLKAGENVATAGNFLIDSQMQLAGKPSVIDPERALAARRQSEGPLEIAHIDVRSVGGEAGAKIEELYAAYFEVQKALSADAKPAAQSAQSLFGSANWLLAEGKALPEASSEPLREIATHAEHLHHLDVGGARTAFQRISQGVLSLAAQVRGEEATGAYVHFYCPMVEEGPGDWLQSGDDLTNPYFGSQMLKCGERVRTLPPRGSAGVDPAKDGATAPERDGV